jgi:hypothetical protein
MRLYSATSQKTFIFILAALRTWNFTKDVYQTYFFSGNVNTDRKQVIFQVLTMTRMKMNCLLGCCNVQSGRNRPTFLEWLLPPSSGRWVIATCFKVQQFCILPTMYYGFRMILNINSDYFPKPTDLYNGDVLCFLWGTDWILKYYFKKLPLPEGRALCLGTFIAEKYSPFPPLNVMSLTALSQLSLLSVFVPRRVKYYLSNVCKLWNLHVQTRLYSKSML